MHDHDMEHEAELHGEAVRILKAHPEAETLGELPVDVLRAECPELANLVQAEDDQERADDILHDIRHEVFGDGSHDADCPDVLDGIIAGLDPTEYQLLLRELLARWIRTIMATC